MSDTVPLTTRGFGTMSLTWTANLQPFEKSIETLNYVKNKYGVKHFNCGDFYHNDPKFSNLDLIAQFLKQLDDCSDVIISIKSRFVSETGVIDSSKSNVDKCIKNALDHFKDIKPRPKFIFESARVDPTTPIEDTVSNIYEHVKSGEIDGVSLSEVSAQSIAKAVKVAPISFIEVELSLFTTDILDNGVLLEASKHNIPIIAYSPLARGQLTDHAVCQDDYIGSIPDTDFKKQVFDRFKSEVYAQNKKRSEALYQFSQAKGIKLETLALSWIESLSGLTAFHGIPTVTQIYPIPSASTKDKIDNDYNTIKLTREEIDQIEKILEANPVVGGRYNADMDKALNG